MNTTNALLIYPEVPPTFWSFKRALSFTWEKGLFAASWIAHNSGDATAELVRAPCGHIRYGP